MKKIFFLSSLLFSLAAFAQTTTKQKDIESLMSAMQIKLTMQTMVSKGIDLYKKQRPAVPQQVWDEIQKSVVYTSYMDKVADIFDKNYTQPEIKELITLSSAQQKLPPLKKTVQEQLYGAGNEFGKSFGNLIKTRLKNGGYL